MCGLGSTLVSKNAENHEHSTIAYAPLTLWVTRAIPIAPSRDGRAFLSGDAFSCVDLIDAIDEVDVDA
jgi:hypothetical protein